MIVTTKELKEFVLKEARRCSQITFLCLISFKTYALVML
ncbi:hypothetical protein AAZX31_18G194400 [Glycine max]